MRPFLKLWFVPDNNWWGGHFPTRKKNDGFLRVGIWNLIQPKFLEPEYFQGFRPPTK